MKECFIPKNFRGSSLSIIAQANDIIEEYEAKGFTLTLRQLYYQFVARDLMANKQSEYKRLGGIINDARLAGLIDWASIEDRTRFLRQIQTYSDPAEKVRAAASGYYEDVWASQDTYVEVWIEKDALVGVIENTCNQWRVPYFPCRGYNSQSEQYEAGKRLAAQRAIGKRVQIFHLGDHDPSGLDMTSDNRDRLRMFAEDEDVLLTRLALNMNQVRRYNPPPNPAKDTDSRFADYRANYGDDCWELDALSPEVIAELVNSAIKGVVLIPTYNAAIKRERANEDRIREVAGRWESVQEFLENQ